VTVRDLQDARLAELAELVCRAHELALALAMAELWPVCANLSDCLDDLAFIDAARHAEAAAERREP
jgi:hypothetical protein